MKRLFLLLAVISICLTGEAQEDVHFSQFFNASPILNPATSGIFHGNMRFNSHYRQQWGSISSQPYTTMAASLDLPVLTDVTGHDMFAIGVYGIKDDAGLSQTSTTNVGLNVNFGKAFDPSETHFFSLGMKVNYGQKALSYDGQWGSQWNWQLATPDFDVTVPGEYAGEASATYVAVGAGFNWFYTNHDNIRANLGSAINNINGPSVNYLNRDYNLARSLYFHGDIEIHSHADNFAVIPRTIIFTQGRQRYFVIGTAFDFVFKEAGLHTGITKEMTMEFGAYFRWRDAFIFQTQFNWAGMGIGLSYDVNISKLNGASRNLGGFEAFLSYKLGYKRGLKDGHSNDRFDSIH